MTQEVWGKIKLLLAVAAAGIYCQFKSATSLLQKMQLRRKYFIFAVPDYGSAPNVNTLASHKNEFAKGHLALPCPSPVSQ
jgi:hypothetical protein